jgi:hypothetical protein
MFDRQEVEDLMPRLTVVLCPCCRLHQEVRDDGGSLAGALCGTCIEHRGGNAEIVLRRAVEHEAMIRSRWEQARSVATDRDERMKAAFQSRARAIRYLRDLRELHEPRKGGACSCGVKKDCESSRLLDSRWIRQMINKLVLAEEDERLSYDRDFWDDEEMRRPLDTWNWRPRYPAA